MKELLVTVHNPQKHDYHFRPKAACGYSSRHSLRVPDFAAISSHWLKWR